jgi:hypothetical protein
MCAILLSRQWELISSLALGDNDDFMRLQQVRDWLAGQSWWDLTQYRLNAPDGSWIHWSRLVDIPLAAVIAGLTPLLGAPMAEQAALALVPMLTLGVLVLLVVKGAVALSSERAILPTAVVLLTSFVVLYQFLPGRIDHHGWQIVCVAGMAAGLAMGRQRAGAWIGALSAAVAIAIGVEGLPYAIAYCAAIALRWVMVGAPVAGPTRLAAAVFALTVLALFAATTPPALWWAPVCDSIARGPVLAAMGFGALMLLLSAAPLQHWPQRLAAGGVGGAAVISLTLGVAPECLTNTGGLAGIDPLLQKLWLSNVREAQPMALIAAKDPGGALSYLWQGVIGLALALWFWRRSEGEDAERWLGLALLAAMAVAVACFMVRGMGHAGVIGAMIAGALIGRLRSGPVKLLPLLSGWILLNGATPLLLGQGVNQAALSAGLVDAGVLSAPAPAGCSAAADFAALQALPPGLVLAPIDVGAPIIAHTRHSVLAAPYHRNNAGNLLSYQLFMTPAAQAEMLVRARGIRYIALCAVSSEPGNMHRERPGGLVDDLSNGRTPEWLLPMGETGGLQLWVVR